MARSAYIYVVDDPGRGPEAFTVKHELLSWLGNNPDPGGRLVWRCKDGRYKSAPPVLMPREELTAS